jgi:hypothetical protein
VQRGAAAWGDYDADGDLDVLLAGNAASGYVSRVYSSSGFPANTPPAAPSGPSATIVGSAAVFSWDAATDAETPTAALTYNLRVGTTPGGSEICSAMADSLTGYRLVPALGNAQQRTSWEITLPEPLQPAYYWSVQAIDQCYAGSPFIDGAASVSGVGDHPGAPRRFLLRPNTPNPFNPLTVIAYDLPRECAVDLRVFDAQGRLVRVLRGGDREPAGLREAIWNGRDDAGRSVASGVYFYRLEAGEFVATERMTLLK